MTTHPPTPLRRITLLLAACVLAIAGALTFGASPASAHDQLLASTPDDGAALDASPPEVTLQYSESVLTIGAIVLLVDQDERNWITGEPILNGSDVTARVDDALPTGAYEVRWRVVSADGHPISGVIPFTVGGAAPAERARATSTPVPSEAVSGDAKGPTAEVSAFRPVLIGVGGAVIAVVVFWIVGAWRRRRPSAASGTRPR
ncbi:copper resistance protein CopC [Plantibacter flavus]|uniref:copper resistance CopC family protein n=1 Tax=Plantibacter flavus TaxID=150123 RepID=UPI003F16AE05